MSGFSGEVHPLPGLRVLLLHVARVLDEHQQVVHRQVGVALVVEPAAADLDGELRAEDDAMALEEATGHEGEDGVRDRLLQVLDALVERLGRLRLGERLVRGVGVG